MLIKHRHMGYMTSNAPSVAKPSRRIASILVCFFLAFSFIAGSMSDVLFASKASSNVVHADPDDDRGVMEDASKDVQKDQSGFEDLMGKTQGEVDEDSFNYVFKRLFTMQYLNHTPKGVASGDFPDKEWQCNVNAKGAGTPVYHNCDVPNILTEFMQTVTALLIPTGPQGAELNQAEVAFGFGLPSTIPGNGTVPVKAGERSVKYTALELFGYNLKYSNYRGEWDDIKVMTSARMLSNFGVMDSLRLGVATVVNGIVGGVSEGVSRALDGLGRGDLLGAIGGFFSGLFEGGASAAVNTVLDTSDMNVFNTNAWYRVDYGATLYRARELNQTEIAAIIQARLAAMLKLTAPDKADLPEDFVKIQAGPPKPKEAISKCMAYKYTVTTAADGTQTRTKSGSPVEIKDPTNPPGGINEGDCKAIAAAEPYNDDNPTWSKDGTQKQEKIADWKVTNKSTFDTASKYNLKCEIANEDGGDRQANLDAFYACWTSTWNSVKEEVKKQNQHSENQAWLNTALGQAAISKFFSKPENNFNAPWNRFVCTDMNGKDIQDANGQPRMLFKVNGDYNPSCVKVRPPIQNGYYGNGYTDATPGGRPGVDTRTEALAHYSIFDLVFGAPFIWGNSSSLGNWGLTTATFFTQASNAVIDLAFSPILQKLGLDTKIVSIIEAFRDSIYFPFISLIVALAGLTILLQAGRRRDYTTAFKDLALVVGTFMLGVLILFNPKGLLKVVDELPSQVETGIIGTIFNVGLQEDDGVCSAAQNIGASGETDLSGNALNFSPRASIRTLECEIWRTFAFNPWVMGQWGTTYDNLYANGHASAGGKTLKNTNGSLVGDAGVVMGGGKTVHNWALYQLDATTAGSSTTKDLTVSTGSTPRDFYRIVDAQAGPNNGAGTDSRYFEAWSGKLSGSRNTIGFMAGVVSIVGFITIAAYSIVKIEITLLTAIMLLLLPIFLLLGLHPTFGRVKLKQYTGTIITLMVQRIVLVTLLAVMLKILTAVSLATQNYFIGGLLAAGICAAFLNYRKEIFGLITNSISTKTGGLFAQDSVDNTHGKFQQMLPLSVRNKIGSTKVAVENGAAGFVGGFVSGGMGGAVQGAAQASQLGQRKLRNRQRRTGVGAFTKYSEAQEAGRRVGEAQKREKYAKTGELTEEQVLKSLNSEFTARRNKDLKAVNSDSANDKDSLGREKADWMNIDPNARMNKADLSVLLPIMSRLSQLDKQDKEGYIPGKNKTVTPEKIDPQNLEPLKAEARERGEAYKERQAEREKLTIEAEEIKERLYRKNANHLNEDYFSQIADDDEKDAALNAHARATDEMKANMSSTERFVYESERLKQEMRTARARRKQSAERIAAEAERISEETIQERYNRRRDRQEFVADNTYRRATRRGKD